VWTRTHTLAMPSHARHRAPVISSVAVSRPQLKARSPRSNNAHALLRVLLGSRERHDEKRTHVHTGEFETDGVRRRAWCHEESVRKWIQGRRALPLESVCVEKWDSKVDQWREVKATAADMDKCTQLIETFVLSHVHREAVRPVEEVHACDLAERDRARLRALMRW